MRISILLGALLLSACGSGPNNTESNLSVSPSWWTNVNRSHTLVAVDKYFSGASTSSFFNCLTKNGVDAYIATYNSALTGGRNVDDHLRNAQAAGLKLSAYFAFNSERDLSDEAIDDFLLRIRPFSIKTVWLDIEKYAVNIDELTINWHQRVCREAGYQCGVYTNFKAMSKAGYPKNFLAPLAEMYLWFAIWDNKATSRHNVGDFYGWSTSHAKQFANGQLCGGEVDVNAFESNLFGSGGSTTVVNPIVFKPIVAPPSGGGTQCQIGNLSGSTTVKIRSQPTRQSSPQGDLRNGARIDVRPMVTGEEIYDTDLRRADNQWAELDDGGYINSLYINCF